MIQLVVRRLADAWNARTRRERMMLTVMGVSLLLFTVWFGLVAPLTAWRTTAIARYQTEAGALAKVSALASSRHAMNSAATTEHLTALTRQSGLNVIIEDLGNSATVRIGSAPSGTLFAWIETLEIQGFHILGLRLFENADMTLHGEVSVALAGDEDVSHMRKNVFYCPTAMDGVNRPSARH